MANLTKEVCVTADNKPGSLARAVGCLKEVDVNIQAYCAWGEGNKATFLLLTDNQQKAIDALKKGGYQTSEREVVSCTLPHRIGSLAEYTQKLGTAGVDIKHSWASANGTSCLVVIETNDNRKAQGLLP